MVSGTFGKRIQPSSEVEMFLILEAGPVLEISKKGDRS